MILMGIDIRFCSKQGGRRERERERENRLKNSTQIHLQLNNICPSGYMLF